MQRDFGAAGSAPVLALLPVSQFGSPWIGIAYLVLFGLGVLAAMMIFGGLLGGLMLWLRRWGDGVITALRSGVAVGAISLGAHMLYVIAILALISLSLGFEIVMVPP